MDPANATEATPGPKEKALFFLKSLVELVENDQIALSELEGKTADEVINMAAAEAAKAVENSQNLKDGN